MSKVYYTLLLIMNMCFQCSGIKKLPDTSSTDHIHDTNLEPMPENTTDECGDVVQDTDEKPGTNLKTRITKRKPQVVDIDSGSSLDPIVCGN